MASKKPGWLINAEARDAKGMSAVNGGNTNNKVSGASVGTRNATGNYTIGSDTGKQQAKNMAIGSTWNNPNDGSVWRKENDGTITVDHNGTTSRNAYTPTDLGILGQQQMAAGLPYQYVMATNNARQNKAWTTPGLEQYANDATHQQMVNYVNDQIRAKNQPQYTTDQLFQWFNQQKPTYEDKYDPEIDAVLDRILNRDNFKYDLENDRLYQQYKAAYQREGDRAMRETMAEAAAGAGGMNSYAITAAQQANNYYNAKLADRIPELYQLAYEMYLEEKDSEIQKLGVLQNMSDAQYARYRDSMSDWQNDRNFAYGAYQDDVAQGNWQQQFDYNSMINNRDFNYMVNDAYKNNQWKEKEWAKEEQDDAYNREQAEKDEAYNRVIDAVNNGASFASIGSDLIKKAGLSDAIVKDWIAKRDSENFNQASSGNGGGRRRSSGSGGSGGGGGDTDKVSDDTSWKKGLSDLGLGASNDPGLLAELSDAGAIYWGNGKFHWANGWNAQNYELNLRIDEKLRPRF